LSEITEKDKGKRLISGARRMNLQTYFVTHFGGFWRWVESIPWLRSKVNRFLINSAITKTVTRPYPFTTLG
jgi:hypothetical protein